MPYCTIVNARAVFLIATELDRAVHKT